MPFVLNLFILNDFSFILVITPIIQYSLLSNSNSTNFEVFKSLKVNFDNFQVVNRKRNRIFSHHTSS